VALTVVATICSVPVLPLEGLALKSVAAVALNPAMLLNMVLKQQQQQQQQRQWHILQSSMSCNCYCVIKPILSLLQGSPPHLSSKWPWGMHGSPTTTKCLRSVVHDNDIPYLVT
jgi:peptidoglycan biosynthesis protein MviN/MurJ (putative lipid II flippase)